MRHGYLALALILLFGLGLRIYHYARNPSVWHDEAALLLNAVEKDFPDHFGPLYYAEAAPPLFLAIEKALSLILGESNFALRLFPFLAGILVLIALILAARKFVTLPSLLWFALLLACSDRLLWHGAEAKPYIIDVLVAAVVIVVFLVHHCPAVKGQPEHLEHSTRLCLWLAALSCLFVLLSFPACFILGGMALTILPDVWHLRRSLSLTASYVLFLSVLCGLFLVLLLGPIQAQRNDHLLHGWEVLFPDWNRPWLIPAELVQRLSEAARYACEPIGNALIPIAVVGVIVLWRQGQRRLVAALLLPIALCTVAWLLRRYPLGPTRVIAFAAPYYLLLVAVGCPAVLKWLKEKTHIGHIVLVGVLLFPVGQAIFRLAQPWERPDTASAVAVVCAACMEPETIIGSACEHHWYFREFGQRYRPIVAEPFAPTNLKPVAGDENTLGSSCWLVRRKRGERREDEAFEALLQSPRWQVESMQTFEGVVIYHLVRKDSLTDTSRMQQLVDE